MRTFLNGFLFACLAVSGAKAVSAQENAQDQPPKQEVVKQAPAEQPAFLTTLTDIPLMKGLEELTEEALVFDKPGGRIVETTAAGKIYDPSVITQFYNRSLPQLGWKRIAENVFTREGEVLEFVVVKRNEYGIIHFSVKPL